MSLLLIVMGMSAMSLSNLHDEGSIGMENTAMDIDVAGLLEKVGVAMKKEDA